MASSPTDATKPVAEALQEAIACWNQAYAALTQGELERVDALLDIAGEHLVAAGKGERDTPAEAALRREAHGSFGRLQHGMRVGMAALQEELARSRQGAKVLRGYSSAAGAVTSRLTRDG
jgi:hypothetical protein